VIEKTTQRRQPGSRAMLSVVLVALCVALLTRQFTPELFSIYSRVRFGSEAQVGPVILRVPSSHFLLSKAASSQIMFHPSRGWLRTKLLGPGSSMYFYSGPEVTSDAQEKIQLHFDKGPGVTVRKIKLAGQNATCSERAFASVLEVYCTLPSPPFMAVYDGPMEQLPQFIDVLATARLK